MRNYAMLQIILNLDALFCSISIHIVIYIVNLNTHCKLTMSVTCTHTLILTFIIDEVHMHNRKTLFWKHL